ncbi:MAG: prolyl oligopeptidase family serine peptidase [Acidobacteria bacterium]|nr:prolyl oligopeptidase family serine peptidase [Acidobacteriota bacterium]
MTASASAGRAVLVASAGVAAGIRLWASEESFRRGFYYARHGDQGPRFLYHLMGSNPWEDREIFGKGHGPGKFIRCRVSDDGRFLLIIVYHGSAARKTEVYCQDLVKPGEIITVVNDIDAKFEGEFGGDQLFLKTNWNAPNERILAVDLRDPKRDDWREIIPETGTPIERMYAFGGKLCIGYLKDVARQLKVFEPDGTPVREVLLPSITRVAPLHAQKMAARLQAASGASDRPVLLHFDTKAGHAGGRPLTKEIDELTDELSFLLWQLGLPFNY